VVGLAAGARVGAAVAGAAVAGARDGAEVVGVVRGTSPDKLLQPGVEVQGVMSTASKFVAEILWTCAMRLFMSQLAFGSP